MSDLMRPSGVTEAEEAVPDRNLFLFARGCLRRYNNPARLVAALKYSAAIPRKF